MDSTTDRELAARSDSEPPARSCLICSADIGDRWRSAIYCSEQCLAVGNTARYEFPTSAAAREYRCRVCHKNFKADRAREHCTLACAKQWALLANRIWRYRITVHEFFSLYEAQKGCCAICGNKAPRFGKGALHIDHSHKSGEVRGLLCRHCNSGVGWFRDNPKRLRAAAAYLEEASKAS